MNPNEYILSVKYVQPYVGNNYRKSGIRQLIIAESNYCDGISKLETNHLITVTEQYIAGKLPRLFWTNIMQTVSGKTKVELQQKGIEKFWDDVALHDYVCDRHRRIYREEIPQKAWKQSKPQFIKVLENLKPQKVILFSKITLSHLTHSHADFQIEAFKVNDVRYGKLVRYVEKFDLIVRKTGQRVPVVSLPHPSRFYKWKEFAKYVSDECFDF